MKSKYFFYILTGFLLTGYTSCKKLVDVPPPVTQLTGSNVYASNATAASVLTGIYSYMGTQAPFVGNGSISVYAGLSADELQGTVGASLNTTLSPYYLNSLLNNSQTPWSSLYSYVYEENAAVDGLTASTTLIPAVQQELIGEAKFLRAFDYFYLTNLFGDVPLAISSDYTVNERLARSSQTLVYQQIITDLKAAQSLLSKNYLMSDAQTAYPSTITSQERVRPNYYAATALLARVYLYTGDYADAVTQATTVINNTSMYSLAPLNNAFLRTSLNNPEAIWQLQPGVVPTSDGQFFVMTAGPPTDAVWLNNNLLSAFETGDQRKTNWVGTFTSGGQTYSFPYKYKIKSSAATNILSNVSEYTMVLRLAEIYLIRAEAEANNNDPSDAVNDLNKIRTRAGLTNYGGATDKVSLLTAVSHERQVELFMEWGHRWLDLKRTGNLNSVMGIVTPQKGASWNPNQALWPIYLNDIQADPNLTQNPGY